MECMKSYLKKIIVILLSIMFLMLYISSSKLRSLFDAEIVSVKVIKEDDLQKKICDKEKADMDPNFLFNGADIGYDTETDTVYIPQNMDNESFEGNLKSSEPGTEIFFAEDELFKTKSDAISEGHVFDLYRIDDENYHVYRVIFTGMPVMNVTTQNTEEKTFDSEGREIYSGTVQLYDPYHSSTWLQTAECTYHIRGASSIGYEKPNYKLELTEKKHSFLGMREDDDWILNSLYDDAGLIHNKVSIQMWREIAEYNNVPNDEGINGEYLELFVDNEYRGVYLLTERVDKKTLSLGKKDILYKCRADRIPEEHNYTNEDTDDMRPIFLLKYPKAPKDEDWDPLKVWVNYYLKEEFETYEEGAAILNMENSVDYNLFCLLIGGMDNLRKNVYFVAKYQDDGTYEYIKIPWDMNATWGNPWVDYEEYNYTLYDPNYFCDVSTWVTDMSVLYYYDEEKVSSLLYERWKELRQSGVITADKIRNMFDEQFAYLYSSGAYERNYECWPNGTEYWLDEYAYEFVDKRIAFLDQYFEQLYLGNVTPAIYDGIDYSDEFEARYYWENNYDTLSQIYTYDRQQLLEHYALYGKQFGLSARETAGKEEAE